MAIVFTTITVLVNNMLCKHLTINCMMLPKCKMVYARRVRGLTLVYEALLVNLKAFFNWFKEENRLINIEPNVWKAFFDCHSSFDETHENAEGIE